MLRQMDMYSFVRCKCNLLLVLMGYVALASLSAFFFFIWLWLKSPQTWPWSWLVQLCCCPQLTRLITPFSPPLSRLSPLLSLRVCFVWQQQPQWWSGWRTVWIKKQSTTASSAWTLTLWPVMMCPFLFPLYFLLVEFEFLFTVQPTLAAHSNNPVPLLFAPNTAPIAASSNVKSIISCVIEIF